MEEWTITDAHFTASLMSILLLLILSTICLQRGLLLLAAVAIVCLVAEFHLITHHPTAVIQDHLFAVYVELCNRVLLFTSTCTDEMSRAAFLITSAFTIGMSGFRSFLSSKVKSPITTCYKLLRSYVTGRTRFSARTVSEKYSDL